MSKTFGRLISHRKADKQLLLNARSKVQNKKEISLMSKGTDKFPIRHLPITEIKKDDVSINIEEKQNQLKDIAKCKEAERISSSLAQYYRRLTIFIRFIAVTIGSMSGYISSFSWEAALGISVVAAFLGILEYTLKWAQLSEKYATLRNEFSLLSLNYNDDKFNEKKILLETSILEQDLL